MTDESEFLRDWRYWTIFGSVFSVAFLAVITWTLILQTQHLEKHLIRIEHAVSTTTTSAKP